MTLLVVLVETRLPSGCAGLVVLGILSSQLLDPVPFKFECFHAVAGGCIVFTLLDMDITPFGCVCRFAVWSFVYFRDVVLGLLHDVRPWCKCIGLFEPCPFAV